MAAENGSHIEIVSSVIRCRNVEKKRQKRTNTRENRLWRASVIHWMRPGKLARSIVVPGSSSSRSFSRLKVSQKCSQLIHRRSSFCLASGLETRNRFQNRQEKNEKKEFYFSSRTKIFLTRKEKRACPRKQKNFAAGLFVTEAINPFTSPWALLPI
jgi:hypothetical protein